MMIDGNARDFIEKLYYEDHYIIYDNEKFFFNGCQTVNENDGAAKSVRLEIYNLSKKSTIFSVTRATATECIDAMEEAAIWNGKTFWEVENDFTWVDE